MREVVEARVNWPNDDSGFEFQKETQHRRQRRRWIYGWAEAVGSVQPFISTVRDWDMRLQNSFLWIGLIRKDSVPSRYASAARGTVCSFKSMRRTVENPRWHVAIRCSRTCMPPMRGMFRLTTRRTGRGEVVRLVAR